MQAQLIWEGRMSFSSRSVHSLIHSYNDELATKIVSAQAWIRVDNATSCYIFPKCPPCTFSSVMLVRASFQLKGTQMNKTEARCPISLFRFLRYGALHSFTIKLCQGSHLDWGELWLFSGKTLLRKVHAITRWRCRYICGDGEWTSDSIRLSAFPDHVGCLLQLSWMQCKRRGLTTLLTTTRANAVNP